MTKQIKERRFKLIEFWRNNRIIGRHMNPTFTFTVSNTLNLPEDVSVTVWF
jgi:hypothetical protein